MTVRIPFAPVLGPRYYQELDVGHYHMLQAHLVREDAGAMHWAYERGRDGKFRGHKVILDCGTWELGEPDVDSLYSTAMTLHPQIIVCPDSFQDREGTLKLAEEHVSRLRMMCDTVMLVPQGDSMASWCECLDYMLPWVLGNDKPCCIGVPKVVESYPGGRVGAVIYAIEHLGIPPNRIHLLGVWDTLWEVDLFSSQWRIPLMGFDTTWPFLDALDCHITAKVPSLDRPKVVIEDWHEWELKGWQKMVAKMNIAYVRRIGVTNG